jgi:RNA-directed DNA polymerase
VRSATRHLADRFDAYRVGKIGFGELDASVKGWVNHVRYADTWGLRRHLFTRLGAGAPPTDP